MNRKGPGNQAVWILDSVAHPRFPYRVTIVKGKVTLLALRVGDRWPGGRGNVFCLREEGRDWPPPSGELERVPVVSLRRYGKRLSVVLDRPTRRCDFLFLTKRYKHRAGEYEQIFWQTQKGLHERRPRARFTVYGEPQLHILIEAHEQYPWRFPGCTVLRGHLLVGDYALLLRNEVAAMVERKTFENLLRDLSDLRVLHQQLGELETYPLAALVIEAEYADFLNPKKNKPLGTPYCVRALAELALFHPRLVVIFSGSRKLGNEWARAFFLAVAGHAQDRPHPQVQETAVAYGAGPVVTGGTALRVRKAILEDFPLEFSFQALRDNFPDVSEAWLRHILQGMRARGELTCRGRGRAARWIKGSTIGFMGVMARSKGGSMAVWRGCGSWGQRSFSEPLDFEMPPQKRPSSERARHLSPLPLSSRDVHRDDAGPNRLWLCSVDEMTWMSFYPCCEEVYRWDPTFVLV